MLDLFDYEFNNRELKDLIIVMTEYSLVILQKYDIYNNYRIFHRVDYIFMQHSNLIYNKEYCKIIINSFILLYFL